MKNKKAHIINLGCRLNIYEGEIIKSLCKKNELKNITIINSCAVTDGAEKKVLYEIRRAKRKNPSGKIIVTGCAAQINPDKFSQKNDVDIVLGNKEKLDEQIWKNLKNINKINVKNIFENSNEQNHLIKEFEGKSRAYIEIQKGCDHRCTFCVIPFGRGNNKSIPVHNIINQIKELVKNHYKEIVLTGVDITDYGKDLKNSLNLFQLVKKILKDVPNLKQLRLSSIDCGEISDEFWPLLKEDRLMPYFHISLQSGNNMILKRMKRRHTKEKAVEFFKKVRSLRENVVFGADLIAGFPTENEEMFQDTIDLIKDCNLTHLHIFPYSKRPLTPAAHMPQIPKEIINKRALILRELGNYNLNQYLKKQIGKFSNVLIEKVDNKTSFGKSQHFTKVEIDKKINIGSIIKCKIEKVENNISKGSLNF